MRQIVAPLQQALSANKGNDKGRASLVAAQETGQADNSTVRWLHLTGVTQVDDQQKISFVF